VGVWGIGNHWCCTEDDLQNGDCECSITTAEATDVEGALAYTNAESPGYSWVTYGLAAIGVGSILYGAGSFYCKA